MNTSRTKIVCTLGPASSDAPVLDGMLRAGMDVARINMSHGTHVEHARMLLTLRASAQETGKPAAVLLDLCGPKIRTGSLPGGRPLELKPGDELVLVSEGFEPGDGEVPTNYARLHEDIRPGDLVLLSDGKLRLRAVESGKGKLRARVEEGGMLGEGQGINLPGTDLSAPALGEKDLEDLAFGVEQGVDYVALSFVRRPEDVEECRAELTRLGGRCPVIAKIEKPEAVHHLDAVLRASDGVMVARGDLAVEMSTPEVPILQKKIIHEANERGRVVITATQMLESMISRSLPTRAEAADVANAVLDGTDALMLSGETAVGKHPVLCVKTMASIAMAAESSQFFRERKSRAFSEEDDSSDLSIAHAAFVASREYKAEALIVFTESGKTARILSKFKPRVPIFALTPQTVTHRLLALVWGTTPVLIPFEKTVAEMVQSGEKVLMEEGLLRANQKVIITAGSIQVAGGTDMLKVCRVGGMRVTG